MSKARLNYALDLVIAIAFILSTASGLVLWLAGSGGYQGGRNPNFNTAFLGLSQHTWSDLHVWVSLVLVLGIVVHFALHWNWVVCMTRRLLKPVGHRTQKTYSIP